MAAAVVPGEVLVKWRDGARGPEVARRHGMAVVAALGAPGRGLPELVSTEGASVDGALVELRSDPSVAYAEPNYVVGLADDGGVAAIDVDDPKTAGQYSLDRMRVRDAWELSTGGDGIVAVLDTGVMATHPDLAGRVLPGRDFVNDDSNAADDNGHGTWVAGIIGANANDGYGIAGISWSDKILPVKIMSREGTGSTADLVAGIAWAADQGATVINMSIGGFPYSQAVQDAVTAAWTGGAVLIGAAGNNRREETFYPASFANVVSVSATQVDDEFSHWSSYGPKVDVSAPGASVQTTNCTVCTYDGHNTWGEHTYISGTSFATPNVAGVVALLRSMFPTETPAQIVDRLVTATDDLGYPGWDNRYGSGRVNAFRAAGAAVATVSVDSSGDALEPNNTLGTPRPVALGATVRPTLYPAGDIDTFAVDVPRMGRLEVRVSGVTDVRDYPWNRSTLPIDPVVELLTTSGSLLTRVDRALESGVELATHNAAGPMRIIVRVSNYYANGNRTAYSVSTTFVDEVPPRALDLRPAPGSAMVLPTSPITFRFSEPVTGVSGTSVTLRTAAGAPILASVAYDVARRSVRVTPAAPMPSSTAMRLSLASTIVDSAGLHLASTSYAFTTMPGETFVPSRRVTLVAGTYVGLRLAGDGLIIGHTEARLARASGANVPQRAALPDLPGAWLYVENGMWAGSWLRESARAHLAGTTELRALPATTRLVLTAGTHVGRQFDASGRGTMSRTVTLPRASGANVDALAVINGRRYYRVTNGLLAGTWLAESKAAYRRGIIDRDDLGRLRRVRLGAGLHTGVAFDAAGTRTGTRSATLSRTSGADVSAWAIINGRAYVRVVNGIWAGTWLPEEDVLAYER
jgi:subtilisin family serine protease